MDGDRVSGIRFVGAPPGEACFSRSVRLRPRLRREGSSPSTRVDVAVTEDSDHNFYVGLDGVIHGIFIATYRPAKLGERVAVTIHLPESLVPVTSFGEVRWLRECDSDSHTPPGIGVHINHLDREEVDAVEEFVSTRAPLLYDE